MMQSTSLPSHISELFKSAYHLPWKNSPRIHPSWVNLWVNPLLCSAISPSLYLFLLSLSCLNFGFMALLGQGQCCHMLCFLMCCCTWPTSHPSQNCFKTLDGFVPWTPEKFQLYLKPKQKIDPFLIFLYHVYNVNHSNTFQTRNAKLLLLPWLDSS